MTERNHRPPTHTLWAKLRTKDGSKPKAFKIGSAWPNDFGGHNVKLEAAWQRRDGSTAVGVAHIEMTDGTRITPESHFIDIRDEAENARRFPRDGSKQQPSEPRQAETGGDDASDDLPF